MKILYATMQFARGYGQGTERYVAMLAAGVRARGHAAVVLAGDPERRGPARPLGAPLDDDPAVRSYPSHGWMSVRGLPPDELRPLLERERPDVVHVANPAHIGVGLLGAARGLGIPTAVTIMDYWWLCPKHTLAHARGHICDADVTWRECVGCIAAGHTDLRVRALARVPGLRGVVLPRLLFGRAVRRGLPHDEVARWQGRQTLLIDELNAASAVIFPSHAARDLIAPRLDHHRTHAIPYGLEERWFAGAADAPIEPRAVPNPAQLTIGYAGALAEHKGVHLLLEAVRELGWAQTRVRIAGGASDAAYERRLRKLAGPLNVEFVGRVASADMPAFLRSVDVLVVPSIWPENLPIVVLEALAVGVPVLGSRVAGIAECLPDETALFDVGSVAGLAARLAAWFAAPTVTPQCTVHTADEMVAATLAAYAGCRAPPAGPR